jgi:hypothetical protein
MNKSVFYDRFVRLLENVKDKYELDTIHNALIVWFGENCFYLDPDEVKERIVNDKRAEGVDAVLINPIDYELLFIQGKTVEDFNKTQNNFSENDLKSTLTGIRFLIKGDYKGRITPELENLVDEYHELDKSGDYRTRIIFLALKNKPVDDKYIRNFKSDFPQIAIDFYDFEWLYDFFVNKYLPARAAPPERISFEILTDLLRKKLPNKSRVFTCRGKELAKVYNDFRERVFQQNVRYSLGLRSKSINRQILETATSEQRSINFWYFNNGITIICKEINEAASGKVINLHSAQIINGAQTTYALYDAYKNGTLKDNVEVLIRAIETDNKDFIENVTLYTNSQNAIRLRDLCSNDEIQLKIQKILLDSYKYFYERKRGEFDSLYPTPESKIKALGTDYKTKIISNENASQAFLAMYLNKPAQAKSEKGRIFLKETGFYDNIFNKNDDLIAEKLFLSWKLLKYIETKKADYKKAYRNIKNLSNDKRQKIYKYDFLLHSEYFVLNLFKDFIKNGGSEINLTKDDMLKIIDKIDNDDREIKKYYSNINISLAKYLTGLKKQPWYYHNKFFKNEKSIGLIRNYFHSKHSYVEIVQ